MSTCSSVFDKNGVLRYVDAVAIGATPKDAINALCHEKFKSKLGELGEELENDEKGFYQWGYRFTSDGGTSFKAAGFFGEANAFAVLVWWK